MMIFKLRPALSLMAVSLIAFAPAAAFAREQRQSDQSAAFKDTQTGTVRSLRSIENQIVPGMEARGAAYIGQEYYQDNQRYRLKFMRGKSLIWVDVDGKSGAVIGQTGR
jgi:hypothetical protein